MTALLRFTKKWGKQYLYCVKSWNDNWNIFSTFFACPTELLRIIYTTNIIGGLNRQFRKVTKNKPSFTNDDSLLKTLLFGITKNCRTLDGVMSKLRHDF